MNTFTYLGVDDNALYSGHNASLRLGQQRSWRDSIQGWLSMLWAKVL
jgi:hypothetical protein